MQSIKCLTPNFLPSTVVNNLIKGDYGIFQLFTGIKACNSSFHMHLLKLLIGSFLIIVWSYAERYLERYNILPGVSGTVAQCILVWEGCEMIFFEGKKRFNIVLFSLFFCCRQRISHNATWITKSRPFIPLRFIIFQKPDLNNELPFLELCIYQEWQRS